MKKKTLKDSEKLIKFYEASRVFYNKHVNQLSDDYEVEMVRRPKEHQMDFEEYCLVVLHMLFKHNHENRVEDPLFEKESGELITYYQQNHKRLKSSWDKNIDDNLFEWVLTSYDRFKADKKSGISLSDIFKNK
jgi:hypothetical protein